MEFRILGRLEALDEGRSIPMGGSKQRALLALLLLHANETLSTERLIDELWGERPPATAAATVQVYISRLRKALALGSRDASPDVIVTRGSGYELKVDSRRLDSKRFEALIAQGMRELAAGGAERANASLEGALALWRGPPLVDLAYESFAQNEIARLEDLRVSGLETLIEAKLSLGRHAEVVEELERLVAANPYRERLHAQLMLALYRCDRQAHALEAYRAARARLVGELGIEPGERLRELERAILAHDPALSPPAERVPDRSRPRAHESEGESTTTGSFVGRESELAELRSGLEDALAGTGSLFLLVGEPGIGKSRLADEVVRRARDRGAHALVGRCWEAGGAPTYWPWTQAMRAYVEQSEPDSLREQLGTGAADLAHILPELREHLGELSVPSFDAEGARFRLFDSMARFLANAARVRPLVIVLDDVHAADEPSLLLLRFLAGTLQDAPILVVGTYRDVDPTIRDPLAGTLAELARERVTRRIELAGFTQEDVRSYLALATGATPAPELVEAIHDQTEGNPLFVGELVRLLGAEGRLGADGNGPGSTLGIPKGLREVIGRRLGRVSDHCRRLLALASVLGREFRLDALERLSDLDADTLLDVLDEAVTERLLISAPGGPGRLRFAHALIRETLYEGLTAPRRVHLHRRAGEALESLYGAELEPHLAELAHHFFAAAPAGAAESALEYTTRAAERALGLLAYEEAARYYELALETLELGAPADSTTRAELLLALGEALAMAGRMHEAHGSFLTVAELARRSGLNQQLARAALGYGGRFPFARAGLDRRLVPLLEEALASVPEEDSVLRVRLLARLAGALRDQPSFERRSALSREAVEIARRLGDKDALGYALVSHCAATWSPDVEGLTKTAEDIGRLAEVVGDSERAAQARWIGHIAHLTLGDTDRAAALVEEHQDLADARKQPGLQWYSIVLRSVWALLRGELAAAESLANEALEVGRLAASWDAGFSHRIAMFAIRWEQDRLDEVDELIRGSVDEYPGYRCFPCLVALIDCELGREDETAGAVARLAPDDFAALPRDGEWLSCLCLLSHVVVELGDRNRAETLHRLLEPYSHLNALISGEVALGAVSRYVGLLAAATERWDEAARSFEHALEMNARMGARPWLAHAEHDYARMLIARGDPEDRERVRRLVSSAVAAYADLGMDRAAADAIALGATP